MHCKVPREFVHIALAHEVYNVHNNVCRAGAVTEGREKGLRRGILETVRHNIRAIYEKNDDIVANFKARCVNLRKNVRPFCTHDHMKQQIKKKKRTREFVDL